MLDVEARKQGIGGSEVAAIFGVDPDRDGFTLWCEKKGVAPRAEPTARMIVGKYLERGVLDLYTYCTGREIEYCDQTARHPARPWQLYTPDAYCKGRERGVDAKVVSWDQRRKWGATADDIPERIQLQCWWYMSATEIDQWDVVALLGGELPRIYTIERDREAERVMLARAEEYWRRHILGDERPPITGSDAASAWLQQAFPTHRRPDLREATEEEAAMLEEFAMMRAELKELAAERDELGNRIKLAIGDREGLTWSNGKFTWRRTADRKVIDWQSMAIGLLYDRFKDEEEREKWRQEYTRVKAGVRRVWLDCDLGGGDERLDQ